MTQIGERGDNTHVHACVCGNAWTHERPPLTATDEEYEAAHRCSACGKTEYFHAKECPCFQCAAQRSNDPELKLIAFVDWLWEGMK